MNTLTCGCEYVDSLILSFCDVHQYPGPESHKDGKGIIIRDLEAQNGELRSVILDLHKFIGETFYANLPHGEKPLPNSWYKQTSKTYGDVLSEILARVKP